MIIFSKLNGDTARFGNQLFRIASTIGIAFKHNHKYGFPEWEYSKYFITPLPKYNNKLKFKLLNEKRYEYHEWQVNNENYDLYGWLQTEKYFDKEKIKSQFKFKPELVKNIIKLHKNILTNNPIFITVRRGDFINHSYYYQVSFKYYFLALTHNFPNWKNRNIIFTSDDINYCKKHFSFIPNSYFLKTDNFIHDMIIGIHCQDYIISNSTFSWWIAWLGENKNTKIIRPLKNFIGLESKRKNDKDFFPDRWILFNEKNKKIPIKYWPHSFKAFITDFRLDTIHFFNKLKLYLKNKF